LSSRAEATTGQTEAQEYCLSPHPFSFSAESTLIA
jgi:hypothetical protein